MFFQIKNSHTGFFFKGSKILKYFNKTALENYIFISKYLKASCHLFLIADSNFLWSQTHMIPDGYILVILKYLLTVIKLMVDIQCL